MKTEVKTVYRCDYCNKPYFHKGHAAYHEKICSSNPENNRPCFGCVHLGKEDALIDAGISYYGTGEPYFRTVSLLKCNKKEIFLYTPKNEIKGNQFEIRDGENHPMPRVCELRNVDLPPLFDE